MLRRVSAFGFIALFSFACDSSTPEDEAGLVVAGACDAIPVVEIPDGETATEKFSFFVTSLKGLQTLSGCEAGFGADLRYGETGPGAGLRGADKICAVLAESTMTGAGHKTWRAFLSVEADENGAQVDAIDRIGNGPWYDRVGRLVSANVSDLLHTRPIADASIADDLPNEEGVSNHQPDPTLDEVDNHDTLTGSNSSGRLDTSSSTCEDWTSGSEDAGKPRIGHSWPHGGGGGSGESWIAAHTAGGCAPGIHLIESGGAQRGDATVGAGGGYGGFYCFALSE